MARKHEEQDRIAPKAEPPPSAWDPDLTDEEGPSPEEEVTALPSARPDFDDEELVPVENLGGAQPTLLGRDSGGDVGGGDDLAHLAEPEPPQPPEIGAMHVRESEEKPRRKH